MPVLLPQRKSSASGISTLGTGVGAIAGGIMGSMAGATGPGAMAGAQTGGQIGTIVGQFSGADRNKNSVGAVQISNSRETMERRLGQGETPMMALKKASAAIESVPRDVGGHYEKYINEAISIAQRMEDE